MPDCPYLINTDSSFVILRAEKRTNFVQLCRRPVGKQKGYQEFLLFLFSTKVEMECVAGRTQREQ